MANNLMKTAILVDGGFFIKRYRYLAGTDHSPSKVAKDLHEICLQHLQSRNKSNNQSKNPHTLYRILFYDCAPIDKKVHNPITGKSYDFSKSSEYVFRHAFHQELKKLRKVALRLGRLASDGGWLIKPEKTKILLNGTIAIQDLQASDVIYEVRQKGVDMKIGLDIASLSYKKLVDQIVLIAGDSDFVPAAKLARREGIDFILDPMWNPVNPDLHEHIDGLQSTYKNPAQLKDAAHKLGSSKNNPCLKT